MSVAFDLLKLRQPDIQYTAPAVCEINLSGSGFPNIDFTPFGVLNPPGPLLPPDPPDDPGFTWPDYPGVLCWNVYLVDPNTGTHTLVADCNPGNQCTGKPGTKCWKPPGPGCYAISGVTLEGETPLSNVVCITENPTIVSVDAIPGCLP